MQKETEFIRSMVEKLKTQSDITQNEAIRIFILAMIMYTYEMGEAFENRRWRDFHDKFDYTEAVSYTHLDVYKRQRPHWSITSAVTNWPIIMAVVALATPARGMLTATPKIISTPSAPPR